MRLAEIGAVGQEKIARARVVAAKDASGEIERRYLVAAGVASVEMGTHENVDARFDALDPAAREVALGAHAAIVDLKKIFA